MEIAKHRNGIRHPKDTREKAKEMRKAGRTHREIVKELGISLGTAKLWVKEIVLLPRQRQEIQERKRKHKWTPADKKKAARRLKAFWFPIRYTREDLINKITRFYKENGRIPLKREFNSFEIVKREFGSWNKAIVAAGFDPNPVLFAKKFISKDGHRCDSFTEKIIDDWLFKRRIAHERHWHYKGTKMTADFFIQPNIVIEFFGLAGVQKQYDVILRKKREFCAEHGFRLVEIYPKDIFPVNKLEIILSKLIL